MASLVILTMLFGLVVVPVSALDYSATIYKNDFQSYTDGASTNSATFVGASRSEVWHPDKSDTAASGAVKPAAANRDPITFFDRGGGDIAMRFGTSSDGYTHSYYTQTNVFGLSGTTFTKGHNDVLHVGADMMAEEKSYDKKLVLRRGRDRAWNQIINFSADGNIKVWGSNICTYNANEWYNIDIWYDFDTKKVYVYMNNKLEKILTDSSYFTNDSESIDIFQLTGQVPAKVKGAMCFGYIDVGILQSSSIPTDRVEVGKLLGFASIDYTAGRQNNSIKLNEPDDLQSDYYRASGKFGKRSDDKSLNIYDDITMGTTDPGSPSHSVDPLISSVGLTSDGNLHLTYLLAIDDNTYSDVKTELVMDDGSKSVIVSVRSDGQVISDYKADSEILPVIEKNRWNRFDIIVNGITDKMDLYVNGEKYIANAFLPVAPSVDGRYQISYNTLSGKEGGFYIDDVLLASYSSNAAPVVPDIAVTSNVVSVTDEGDIKVPFDYTVSQLKAAVQSSSLSFEVRSRSGAVLGNNDKVIEAERNNNYIVFLPGTGGEYYCDIVGIPNPPTAEITGVSDSAEYAMDDIPEISVNTTKGTYNISKVELYVDGEVLDSKTASPYTFDLGTLSIGNHIVGAKVYDIYGNYSEATPVSFNVIKTYIATFTTKHAFYNPTSTSYDTSGTIVSTASNGNLSYMYTVSNGTLIAESDMTFSHEGVSGSLAIRAVKSNSSNEDNTVVSFADGKITLGSTSGEQIGSYTVGKEYHFYCAADAVNKKYCLIMTDIATGTEVANTGWLALPHADVKSISIIRIFCTASPVTGSGIVCDNVKTSVKSEYPEFVLFADSDGTSPVSYGSETIVCTLSSVVETVTKDNVKAENSLGQVGIKAVELADSTTLKITFENPLLSSMTYKITLDESVKLLNQTPTGMEISGEFTTTSKDFDVTGGSFATAGGISFTANIANSGSATDVTVIIAVYDNGVLKGLTAKTGSVPNGGGSVTTPKLTLPQGGHAEAFVIESWAAQLPVSPKLFKYQP